MPIISSFFIGANTPLHAEYQSHAIAPSDSTDLPTIPGKVCVGIYAGGTGNMAITSRVGVAASFTSIPAGTILDVAVRRVLATGTTATALQALYQIAEN